MCGRYEFNIELDELVSRYKITDNNININEIKEVFPSMEVPVINSNNEEKQISNFRWGFNVTFSKRPIINARSETVHNKSTFRESFYNRRCIIPARSFFEWENINNKKVKHRIYTENNLFSMAGIYNKFSDKDGKEYYGFTILTKEASNSMKGIHERMPVILEKNDEDKWLDTSITEIKTLKIILSNSLDKVIIK